MDYPIIDASTQSLRQFEIGRSRAKAVRSVAWYRFIRPGCVAGIWVLAGCYIQWCLVHASPAELSIEAFTPTFAGIGGMASALMLWTLGRHVAQRQGRVRAQRVLDEAPRVAMFDPHVLAIAGRCMTAYHDDDGAILHVMPHASALEALARKMA